MKSSTRRALKKHAELKGDWGNIVYSSVSPQSGNIRGEGSNMKIYTKRNIVNLNGLTRRGRWVKAFDPEGDYNGPYAFGENLLRHPRHMADMAEHRADMAKHAKARRSRRSRSKSRRSKSRSKSRGTRRR